MNDHFSLSESMSIIDDYTVLIADNVNYPSFGYYSFQYDEKKYTAKLKNGESFSIMDFMASNLLAEDIDFTSFDWIVEDGSIAKIENGKVISFRTGTTKAIATVGDKKYVIDIVIIEDIINPKTGTYLFLFGFLFIFAFVSLLFLNLKNNV